MNPSLLRRCIMAVGAAFLAGGWAAMHYADLYQGEPDATETFSLAAVSMVLGAGLMGFAVLREK